MFLVWYSSATVGMVLFKCPLQLWLGGWLNRYVYTGYISRPNKGDAPKMATRAWLVQGVSSSCVATLAKWSRQHPVGLCSVRRDTKGCGRQGWGLCCYRDARGCPEIYMKSSHWFMFIGGTVKSTPAYYRQLWFRKIVGVEIRLKRFEKYLLFEKSPPNGSPNLHL